MLGWFFSHVRRKRRVLKSGTGGLGWSFAFTSQDQGGCIIPLQMLQQYLVEARNPATRVLAPGSFIQYKVHKWTRNEILVSLCFLSETTERV